MPTVERPPHIILICSDQHRADSISAYGNPVCRTPNLDRIAAQGVLLERCFAQNPVCSPQRSSLLTGRLSRNHGVYVNGIPLTRGLPTLADILAARGYRTAAFGKLHLAPQNEGVPPAPHYGFEHLEYLEDSKVGPYTEWVLSQFPEFEGYIIGTMFNLPNREQYWKGRRDFRKEYLHARERHVRPLEISGTCNWGFGHYNPMPEQSHQNAWIADRVLARLEACDPSEPQFLWVGFVDPHNPFDPPGRFQRMYPPESVDERIHRDGEEDLWPPHTRAFRRYYEVFTEQDWRILRALYYGSVAFMDEQIGRIVAAIEERLDMRNTILVYAADHGEILGDHGICGKCAYHYDSCIRVPMICRWDGHWGAGLREREITESTDLVPTLLEAVGVEDGPVMDGMSLGPLLRGERLAAPRGHAYSESYSGGPEDPTPAPITWAKTIRTDRWRATFYPNADYGELFDLANDPEEVYNLWFKPEQRAVVDEHRRILLNRLVMMDYPIRRSRSAV